MAGYRHRYHLRWSNIPSLLSVANLKHDSDYIELEGVQRFAEVARAVVYSNFIGPPVSARE